MKPQKPIRAPIALCSEQGENQTAALGEKQAAASRGNRTRGVSLDEGADNAIVTIALAIACGVLAVLAGVLAVLLIRPRVRRARPSVAPEAAPTPEAEQLARDLQGALAQYREEAQMHELPKPSRPSQVVSPRREAPPRRPPSPEPVRERTGAPAPPPRPLPAATDAPAAAAAPTALAEDGRLQELLGQTLATAQAIPGADAAAVALPAWHEPLLGTLGLARHEADRLASTLPAAGARTRSISIEYEYDDAAGAAPGRLQHGIAVPITGLPTAGLVMILTRSHDVELGASQVELLEEIVNRLAPALARVLEWDAAATPVAVTVRERADRRASESSSVQSEEGQEVRQLHRFHDR